MTTKKQEVMDHDPLADLDLADAAVGGGVTDNPQLPSNEKLALPEAAMNEAPMEQMDGRVLELDSCLTIAEVGPLAEQLAGVFDSGDSLVLNGGEIEQIDGAGIQLLAGLMKEAAAQQAQVAWSGTTVVLREAAAQLGLAELLHLHQA